MAGRQDTLRKHDKFLDSLIDQFDTRLQPILNSAQKRTLKEMESKLTLASDGSIEVTPGNQLVLRSIDRVFKKQMKRAGYDKLVGAFSDQFADHLPRFQDVLNDVTGDTPLPPIKFTNADVDLFASQAIGAKEMLLDVVEATGAAAKRQSLFSVGGLKFSDLASEIGDQFQKTAAQAKTLADTSVSSFYRTIADQAYQKIEADLPKGSARYFYAGPDDDLERDFCANLTGKGLTYTREQIEGMDNGQIPGVFTSCGGYRCRHLWILDVTETQSKGAA